MATSACHARRRLTGRDTTRAKGPAARGDGLLAAQGEREQHVGGECRKTRDDHCKNRIHLEPPGADSAAILVACIRRINSIHRAGAPEGTASDQPSAGWQTACMPPRLALRRPDAPWHQRPLTAIDWSDTGRKQADGSRWRALVTRPATRLHLGP